MNGLLRSLLLAIADAVVNWLQQIDDEDVVIEWLHNKLDEYIDDTNNNV
jgi:hypothetical protein